MKKANNQRHTVGRGANEKTARGTALTGASFPRKGAANGRSNRPLLFAFLILALSCSSAPPLEMKPFDACTLQVIHNPVTRQVKRIYTRGRVIGKDGGVVTRSFHPNYGSIVVNEGGWLLFRADDAPRDGRHVQRVKYVIRDCGQNLATDAKPPSKP